MRLAVNILRSATICWVVVVIGVQSLVADEPAARFVNALREKGYYDIALEYLDKAKNNPNVSEGYRKRIKFEKATIIVDQIGQLSDRKQIDVQLDTAQRLLKEYAANNNSQGASESAQEKVRKGVENARTLSFRSRLLTLRADVCLRDADAAQLTEGEREKIRKEARGYLEESLESVGGALQAGKELLDPKSKGGIKISQKNPQTELRKEMKSIYSVMAVQKPFNAERIANTFPERSPERKSLLESAISKYKEVIGSKLANTVPGVRASLRAGLCSQQLGKHDDALDFFKQVMFRQRSTVIDSLQKQAFAAATDSWQASKEYPISSVISQLEPLVEKLTRAEKRDPDWLRVMMELGVAKHKLSQNIKKEGDVPKSKKVLREAGRLVREVTRVKNPHRDRAKKLLEKWDVPLIESADVDEGPKEIKSFADAIEVGRDEMSSIELLANELLQARAKLKAAPPAKQAKLTAGVEELEKRLREEADKTISIFSTAMSLANSDTSADEINLCRFYQCFCYFVTNRHVEVSVIGQYLLQQHPNDAGTKSAVGLLMKSRSAAHAAAPKDDNEVELESLKNTALEVASRWPGSAEAGGAISELIQIEMRASNLPQAVELMDRLPDDSVQRPRLSAMVGQRLWIVYQRDSRNPETRNNTNELNKKLDQAMRFLEVGVATADSSNVSFSDAVSGLNLVDALLAKGETERALEMLGSPLGPEQVIKSNNSAVLKNPRADLYLRNAYSVMIKTYLSRLATDQDQQKWLDKCDGLLQRMEKEVEAGRAENAKQQLTASYFLISVELKKRFEVTTNQKKRLQLARALARFLPSIERNSTENGRVLLNVGSALMGMATTIAEGGDPKNAQPLFAKASKTLTGAERLGFAGDKREAQLKLELSRQRALALRGAGQYEKSIETFIEILKTSKALTIQLDAAATLQQWGKSKSLESKLFLAVKGTGLYTEPNKRPTNAIWGWRRIMHLTQGDKTKFRDQYYTAAYGNAEAIYEQGKLKNQDRSKRALSLIEKEKNASADFLGSKVWKQKFSELEKRIKGGG